LSDVNANIGINFDTQEALAQLRQLQAGLSRFNQSLTEGNVAAANAQKGLNAQLVQAINASGKFVASQKDVASSTSAFTTALEKNQLSLKQYFRYSAAAATADSKVFQKLFSQERDILNRARRDRVKMLQSQYIQLNSAQGDLVKTLQIVPKHLEMVNGKIVDYTTKVQMAAQRQQFLNQLLKQGSTNLINFGKNTQWAGRQLMVGFTVPLTMLGSFAAKTFREMEEASVKFSRVYGSMFTPQDETDKMIAQVRLLGQEFTKYGIAASKTMDMAATAAAAGFAGADLVAQTTQATRLAVLGQVEQQQALETTISLQNAFGLSADQLAQKINFLNAVENQTLLSIEDLTIAIPKAAPIVKQLGGSVEDLAYFMTAMKEGGINASEGANALKSGLAAMINPTKKVSEMLAGMGININGIVNANAGNLRMTVLGFAQALDTLDPLSRARAIEQMFGKFQFARLSTLFQNITKDGSQASRALGLAGNSVEELAILSERELGKVEDATGVKFQKTIEELKIQLIPLGKAFLQAVTPVVAFLGKVLEKFNGFSEGTKKVIAIVLGVVGALAPAALMAFGLVANGLGQLVKLFAFLRGGMAKLNGQNQVLGGGFDYLTNSETENIAASNSLHLSHKDLISTFNVETGSVNALALAYTNAASQARTLAAVSPGLFNTAPGPAGAVSGLPPRKYADGVFSVPGPKGAGDVVPAMLSPGEAVLPTAITDKYGPLIAAMMTDSIPGYKKSNIRQSHTGRVSGGLIQTRTFSGAAIMGPGNQASGPVDGSSLAGMDSNFIGGMDGATDQFKAAMAAAMKTQMMQVDGVTKFNAKTYQEYSDSWSGIDDVLDQIADEFAKGIKPGVTDVSQLGQNQFPLIMQHIDELESSLKITSDQANTLRESSRKLFNPDLGTPANPGRDAVAKNRQRIETGIDDNGNEVVTRVGVERVALDGKKGSDYLDARTKANTEREYARRGVTPPESATFAHIKSGEKSSDYIDPIASARDGISAAEQKIVDTLTSGGKIKEGTVIITKRISDSIEEGLSEAEKRAETASPSKRTERLGKDIGDGLKIGLESKVTEVRQSSRKLGDAAVPDKANKAYYDSMRDSPDEFAKMKSIDRQRRKLAKKYKTKGSSVTTTTETLSAEVSLTGKQQKALKEAAKNASRTTKASGDLLESTKDSSKHADKLADTLGDQKTTVIGTTKLEDAINQTTSQTALVQEQIEAEKQKQLMAEQAITKNAQTSAANGATNGTIPPGNQSTNIPSTYLSESDALKEASKYAKVPVNPDDPSLGTNILMNGATGTPFTNKQMSKLKRQQRAQKVSQVSGKMSGALGVGAMVAGAVGAPTGVTAALGGASMVAQMAPMIAGLGPFGIAAAALAGATGGLYMLDKAAEAAAKAQTALANKTQMTSSTLKAIGESTGKVGASEIMDRRRQEAKSDRYTTNYDRKGQQFGTTFLSGDAGKSMAEGFSENIKIAGKDQATQQFAANLALAVSDGVMTSVEASDVARQMAIKFEDTALQPRIDAELNRLIGPYGEDLLKNPLQVRINLIDDQSQISKISTDKLAGSISQDNSSLDSKLASIGTILLPGGIPTQAALSGSNFMTKSKGYNFSETFTQTKSEKVASFGAASNANNMGAAQSQLDAYNLESEKKIKELEAERAITTEKSKQEAIDIRIQTAQDEQAAGAQQIRDKIAQTLDDQLALFAVAKQRSAVEGAFFDSLKESVNLKYKGTAMEAFTGDMLDKSADLKSKELEVTVNTIVASGQVNPLVMTDLLDAFTGDEDALKGVLDVAVKTHGADKIALLINNLGGIKKPEVKKKLTVAITKLPTKDMDRINDTLVLLGTMDQKDFDINVYLGDDADKALIKLKKLQGQLEGIETVPDPLTKAIQLENVGLSQDAMNGITANWEYFMSLPETVRKTAIQTYVTAFTTVTDDAVKARIAKKVAATGGASTVANYYATPEGQAAIREELALEATKPQYSPNGEKPKPGAGGQDGGGKGDNPLSFLDDLAMRVKMVRKESFDATNPIKSMLAAFRDPKAKKNIADMFNSITGLQQKLITLKAPKEFRDYIAGLSADDLNKLKNADADPTKKGNQSIFKYGKFKSGKNKGKENREDIIGFSEAGQAIMQTYKEAPLADFNVAQKEVIQSVQDQTTAFNTLLAAGLSTADALKVVEDTALAASIASGALGEIGSTEMTGYVADIKLANDALAKQAVLNKVIQENADFDYANTNYEKLAGQLKAAGIGVEGISKVLGDPELAKQLVEDLRDGNLDSKEIRTNLENIPKEKIITLKARLAGGDFVGVAQEGLNLVDEMFAVQEELLRTGVDPRTTADVAKLQSNEKTIKGLEVALIPLQQKVKALNDEIANGQREIEMSYERPMADLGEQINDLQRDLEVNPIFGDRAIKAINDANAKLSHDLTLIQHDADAINKKYDEQAEALAEVQRINEAILNQQKEQLDLADAITSGDISSAAKAAQQMRQTSASQFATGATDALQQARDNAIASLTGKSSGLTQEQIQQQQFINQEKIYAMETNPDRLAILESIKVKQDEIYAL